MTVLIHIDGLVEVPVEHEVPKPGAKDNSYTQPSVVGHEDEHEEVAECHLDHVEYGLQDVTAGDSAPA